ncbi:hypothetical protein ACFLQ7_01875 [Actinomycetota bacterium]
MTSLVGSTTTFLAGNSVDHRFGIEFGPPDGCVVTTEVFEWVLGSVYPEAVVTVNGERAEISEAGDGSYEWTLANGTIPDGDPRNGVTIPLQDGVNTVVFHAAFDDGTIVTRRRHVTLDTTLATHHGWILDTGDESGEIRFAVAEFVSIPDSGEGGYIAGEMWGEPVSVDTYPVRPDARFILLSQAGGRDPAFVLDFTAFIDAVHRADSGECSESKDCFWKAFHGVTASPQDPGGLPFVAFIDTDGNLVQLEQQWGLP